MACIKVKFQDDIRRIRVDRSTRFSLVKQQIDSIYSAADSPLKLPAEYAFTYVDNEGDEILVATELDFIEALRLHQDRLLRLTIVEQSRRPEVLVNVACVETPTEEIPVLKEPRESSTCAEPQQEIPDVSPELQPEVPSFPALPEVNPEEEPKKESEVDEALLQFDVKEQVLEVFKHVQDQLNVMFHEIARPERQEEIRQFLNKIQTQTESLYESIATPDRKERIMVYFEEFQQTLDQGFQQLLNSERTQKLNETMRTFEKRVEEIVHSVVTPERKQFASEKLSQLNNSLCEFFSSFSKTFEAPEPYPFPYLSEVQLLESMGFSSSQQPLRQLLMKHSGDISSVIDELL